MSSFYLLFFLIFVPFVATEDSSEFSTLLKVKSQLQNPSVLNQWNSSSTSHCQWDGITCSNGTVVMVNLSYMNIEASFPLSICELKNLTHLDFAYNFLNGEFPRAVYSCRKLQHLDISQNNFVGKLPSDIDTLSSLQYLNVGGNGFYGLIPLTIQNMTELRFLKLYSNDLTGFIPKEIGNLHNLEELHLSYNEFYNSEIPVEIGNLRNLKFLWLVKNNLSGSIPESFCNLTKLEHLDMSGNDLEGKIPDLLFTLKNLTVVYLYHNQLSGEIPQTVEAVKLKELDLSMNKLTGEVPEAFGNMGGLKIIDLSANQLSGELPRNLGLIPSLQVFRVYSNNLTGVLPPEMGLYSKLQKFEVSENRFTGELPRSLCAGGDLKGVVAFSNMLSGNISSLGNCSSLISIQLYDNSMSGEIPDGIWECPALRQLMVNGNSFSGELPTKLGSNLSLIDIGDNEFSGTISLIMFTSENLTTLTASNNQLTGEIPAAATTSSTLQELHLDRNHLSGKLPSRIISWKKLNALNLSGNNLTGELPTNLVNLSSLNYLDLSVNQFSGSIPSSFDRLKLIIFNLSSNLLSGAIPAEYDINEYATSFLNNPNLCSNNITSDSIRRCSIVRRSKKISTKNAVLISLAAVGFLFLVILTVVSVRDYHRKKFQQERTTWKVTAFQRLNFTEEHVLQNLQDVNLIGSGGSGKVYRIPVNHGEYVAVKKIWTGQQLDKKLEKEFAAEVQILGHLKHTNIVKLLCCISSEDSKLLVYQYMENSSVDRWLWPNFHGRVLDWPTRLKIAIGAAQGLCYMHHCCPTLIIHRDVKSSNILLDSEFNARIADFGVARMLTKEGEDHTISTVAGSFGYIAPEYGYTSRVSEKVDIYSFGVVLLELVTGKEARNGGDEMGLADWSLWQFSHGSKIADCFDEEIKKQSDLEEMSAVFKLGLQCTSRLPASRPSMKEVLEVLKRCQQLRIREKQDQIEVDVTPLLEIGH